jgi:DNA-binding NtrC family response regulator
MLGIDRSVLRRKLQRYGLDESGSRPADGYEP